VITLTLLHPLQSIPVRSWVFNEDNVIRIGRSLKNDVVLYSAVVSRYHVEICHQGKDWVVVNLGTNGTYLNGQAVQQIPLVDGQVIHLAISGPKILLNVQPDPTELISTTGIDLHQREVISTPELLFAHQNEETTEVDLRQKIELPTNHPV
jgi:pSer/pThr/pTyr-binding forkhead associated (FHA) protein